MKRYIDMPQEMASRAVEVLMYKDALDALFQRFVREIAASKYQTTQFWAEAEKKMKEAGIEKGADEVLVFDFVTEKFYITKAQQ